MLMGGPTKQDASALEVLCPSSNDGRGGMQGMLLAELLQSRGGPWLRHWASWLWVYGLCAVFPGSMPQTWQHRQALPLGDSGETLTGLADAQPAAQLLCKQF